MPSYSGTVSASQGVRTIDVTPNDVVTFTPSSATYTVEYPIGTVAISASTGTQSLTANTSATQMRILCVSGAVAYANVDNNDGTPLTPAEATAARSLMSQAGISSATYDGSGRLTGYTRQGVAHTVSYPSSTTVVVSNTTGAEREVTLDGSGRVQAIA